MSIIKKIIFNLFIWNSKIYQSNNFLWGAFCSTLRTLLFLNHILYDTFPAEYMTTGRATDLFNVIYT